MSYAYRHQPLIPMAVFRKLAHSLSPDELSRLPPEKLPDNIPLDFVEEVPLYSRSAVETLILAANAYHLQQRMAIQEVFGEDVLNALDRSKRTGNKANVKIFRQKLSDLEKLDQQWRQQGDDLSLQRLVASLKTLNGLLMDVRAEVTEATRAARLLRAQHPDYEQMATFEEAIARLHAHAEDIELLLARFYLIRTGISHHEMQAKARQIGQLDEDFRRLGEQIEDLREQLERSQALWRRALVRGKANLEGEQLQQRISDMVAEQRAKEVVISENDLTLWLDAIVDASLHPFTRKKVARSISEARMALYTLLNRYCLQQEQSAMQIARNPFLQVDPEDAIRFMLMSEQFILNYFARKRNENTAWISDVAQVKKDDLDALERDILTELKRSSKFMRKG
ncbi:hypothetical protein [Thioalkalivibrio sulfidiphilus]|uniref:Uncharacterized protein n=1 Tax=Thioalkalivibrio sulfidiphilus (strain HL-EbGR7) TaxID=396588 RepID=B8GPZ4_THISH|nr:hypothetical protein [Thioalkalivibrio sulfidiphilus]ACL74141.1 hypothetical protein Tgr7_3072 [Thioalkalivibrio sulfidiphilus HL-EbGr7]